MIGTLRPWLVGLVAFTGGLFGLNHLMAGHDLSKNMATVVALVLFGLLWVTFFISRRLSENAKFSMVLIELVFGAIIATIWVVITHTSYFWAGLGIG